jgi:MmyB-like transcription regulator ligand binding domain
MTGAPALVRNDRLDILATNPLGRALYSELYRDPVRPANHARFAFLDPPRPGLLGRLGARCDRHRRGPARRGRTQPYDKALSALVGELSTRSEDFRTRWAAHNVHLHRTGTKLINHAVVERLELMYDTLQLTADTGLTMLVYTAEPGSSSADALTLLASWVARSSRPS